MKQLRSIFKYNHATILVMNTQLYSAVVLLGLLSLTVLLNSNVSTTAAQTNETAADRIGGKIIIVGACDTPTTPLEQCTIYNTEIVAADVANNTDLS